MTLRMRDLLHLFASPARFCFCGLILAALANLSLAPVRAADPLKAKSRPQATASTPYKTAIVIDAASGAVLFEQAADRISPPASMTKLMTFLLVHDAIARGQLRLDSPIRITAASAAIGGTQVCCARGKSSRSRNCSTPSCSTRPTTAHTRSPSQLAAPSKAFLK